MPYGRWSTPAGPARYVRSKVAKGEAFKASAHRTLCLGIALRLKALDVATAIGAEASDGFEADPVNVHPPSKLSSEVFELAVVQLIE